MNDALRRETLEVDLCVVGGGLAGLMAAVSAARNGLRVALMQDRPVLGGNCSSEIRMWVRGAHGDRNHESGLLEELELNSIARNPRCNFAQWDAELYSLAVSEPNLTLLLNCSCLDAETDGRRVVSVTGWQLTTYTFLTVYARLFADCSGDAVLAPLVGADFRVGREAADEFDEDIEPVVADTHTMGLSCLIQARETDHPVPFTPPLFAQIFPDDSSFPYRQVDLRSSSENYWWMELGGENDSLHDTERVKTRLLALAYGVWDHLKNHGDHGAENWALEWVGFLPGKRESRRYVCDHTLTQREVQSGGHFPDTVAYGGWALDDHHPAGFDYPGPPNINHPAPSPFGIPYGSLVVRDADNLLCAGRNIGVTHIALSSVRVMATCALEGQAVGTAAALALRDGVSIHALDTDALQQALMEAGCWLPGFSRRMSAATRAAEYRLMVHGVDTPLSPDALSVLHDGFDRDLDMAVHHVSLPVGAEIAMNWRVPSEAEYVRISLDTELTRRSVSDDPILRRFPMRCNEPLNFVPLRLPRTIVRSLRVTAVRPDGAEDVLLETEDNHQGLLRLPLNGPVSGLRVALRATCGAETVGLFGLDVQ